MNNQIRRELLNRHRQSGFPGSIMDVFSAYNAGRDIISEFVQEQQKQQQLQQMQQMQQQQSQPIVANTPEEQEQGLRPYHEAGQTDQSMVFPNVPANTPFNTVGMKAPINIDKYDNQGHLIESFKSVPPGIQNLPTGPQEGTVVETPANMQTGGEVLRDTRGNPITIALPPADITTNSRDNSFWGRVKRHNQLEDSRFENIAEFFDPSGVASWDDAYRARTSWKESGRALPTFTETSSMLSALPGANIVKGMKGILTTAQKLQNAYARTVKRNNYIDAANENISSNMQTGGVRRYQTAGPVTEAPRVPALSDAEMSLKIIQEANAGNPAARRMRSDYGQRMFLPGETSPSTHYMASFDNYAVPTVQEEYIGGPLKYNPNPNPGKEDFRFDTPEQAAYFSNNYKNASASKALYRQPEDMQTGGAKPTNRFTSLAIAQDMAERFGGDPRTYLALSDTVAFHESFHTMNPKMEQITDSGEPGPGKGAFQIEEKSMETYRNRAENYAKSLGLAPPQWAMNAPDDARKLTMDQQRALFLMNMAENARTSMRNYQQGNTSTTEQWLRGWKGIEKPGDRQAFRTSTQLAREKGIPNSSVEQYNQMLRDKAKAAHPLPPTELIRMLTPSRNK